ncbi:hypothetical protein VE00_10738 [Pseudogymnoascus sp. WSF 3629]|nr:hypothetical protein VE00_10738 [Pseudogymnoascus sp. WSF 3629]
MSVDGQGCLNVPLPRCIRELVTAPPVPISHPGDGDVLDLLKEFGRKYNRDINEIRQACNLATGYSDLVVILQRPAPRHDYSVDFEKFVADCPTLDAVNKLIKYTTGGTRSIEMVSVFDAYSFKPGVKTMSPSDDECHLLLVKMLKAKGPKAVLCCWSKGDATYSNEFITQLIGGRVGNPSIRDGIYIEGWESVAIRSFHPATAMCYNPYNADYQALLTYHFIAAFSELRYRFQEPWWLEKINARSKHAIK